MKAITRFLQEDRSFEKKDSVKAIVKCPKEHILIVRRANDEGGGGEWDIPGGAIEKGEDQNSALKREVFEEVDIHIDDIKKIKDITLKIPESGVNSVMHIYSATTDELSVNLKPATWTGSDGKPEHTEYRWVSSKEEMEGLPMLDSLKSVVLSQLK